jgi:hypothetical protein
LPSAGRDGLIIRIAWDSCIDIRRSPEAVFGLLANIQNVGQTDASPVLALDLTTADPPHLGSKYREDVKMTPFFKREFLSQITLFDPLEPSTWPGRAPG